MDTPEEAYRKNKNNATYQQGSGQSSSEQTSAKQLDPDLFAEYNNIVKDWTDPDTSPVHKFVQEAYKKPDPAEMERQRRKARNRKFAKAIADSMSIIAEGAGAFAGGNVDRHDYSGTNERIDVPAKEAEARYNQEMQNWRNQYINLLLNDQVRADAFRNKAIDLATTTKQTGKSDSSQSSVAIGGGNSAHGKSGTRYGYGYGNSAHDKKYYTIPVKIANGNGTVKANVTIPPELKGNMENAFANTIVNDSRMIDIIGEKYTDYSNEQIKEIISSGKLDGKDASRLRESIIFDIFSSYPGEFLDDYKTIMKGGQYNIADWIHPDIKPDFSNMFHISRPVAPAPNNNVPEIRSENNTAGTPDDSYYINQIPFQ